MAIGIGPDSVRANAVTLNDVKVGDYILLCTGTVGANPSGTPTVGGNNMTLLYADTAIGGRTLFRGRWWEYVATVAGNLAVNDNGSGNRVTGICHVTGTDGVGYSDVQAKSGSGTTPNLATVDGGIAVAMTLSGNSAPNVDGTLIDTYYWSALGMGVSMDYKLATGADITFTISATRIDSRIFAVDPGTSPFSAKFFVIT